MKTDNILGAKYHARHLGDQALLAHYAEHPAGERHHVRQMHEIFLKLADDMGYFVQLRSAEEIIADEVESIG